jgi:methylglyoxal synthase
MPERKIALIAHDEKKQTMLELVERWLPALGAERLVATGTTGALIAERIGIEVERVASGPKGGDLQIGGMVRAVRSNT